MNKTSLVMWYNHLRVPGVRMKICPKTIKFEEYRNGCWCYYTSVKRPLAVDHVASLVVKYGLTQEIVESLING